MNKIITLGIIIFSSTILGFGQENKDTNHYPKKTWEKKNNEAPLPAEQPPRTDEEIRVYQTKKRRAIVAVNDPEIESFNNGYSYRSSLDLKALVQKEIKNLLMDNGFIVRLAGSGRDARDLDKRREELKRENSAESQNGRGVKPDGFLSGTDYLANVRVVIISEDVANPTINAGKNILRNILGGSRNTRIKTQVRKLTIEINLELMRTLNGEIVAQGQGEGSQTTIEDIHISSGNINLKGGKSEELLVKAVKNSVTNLLNDMEINQ